MHYAFNSIVEDDGTESTRYSPEATKDFLAQITSREAPNHELHLKPGAICSIMWNLSIKKGLVKNKRVIVMATRARYIEAQRVPIKGRSLKRLINETPTTTLKSSFLIPAPAVEAPIWFHRFSSTFVHLMYHTPSVESNFPYCYDSNISPTYRGRPVGLQMSNSVQ